MSPPSATNIAADVAGYFSADAKNLSTIAFMDVPVSEEVYNEFKRSMWRENKRTRYRIKVERSLEMFKDDGYEIPSDVSVEETVEEGILLETLAEALRTLTEDERSLIDALFFQGKTLREVAADRGLAFQGIARRKDTILHKLKKILS